MTHRAAEKRIPRRARLSGAGAAPLTLAADCTARGAEAMQALLLAGLEQPGSVSIEVAAVERVDTVCLQLLVAFVRDRQRAGRSTLFSGHSQPLARAASLLGLSAALGLAGAG